MRPFFCFLLLLVLPTSARAGDPADLRDSLHNLQGHDPVTVSVAYAVWREHTPFLKSLVHQSSSHLRMREDATGLHVDWPPSDSRAAGREQSFPEDGSEAQRDLDAVTLDGLLHPAKTLSLLIGAARFVAETRGDYHGQPARVLEYTLHPPIRLEHQGLVSRTESSLKLWIREDGVPLATESRMNYEGRRSRLSGRIHGRSLVRTTYSTLGQRLVVSSQASEAFDYDSGETRKVRKTLTLAKEG